MDGSPPGARPACLRLEPTGCSSGEFPQSAGRLGVLLPLATRTFVVPPVRARRAI